MAEQRLQKVLAAAGVDSRRKCEELILEGVVRVNRKVVDKLPAFARDDLEDLVLGLVAHGAAPCWEDREITWPGPPHASRCNSSSGKWLRRLAAGPRSRPEGVGGER